MKANPYYYQRKAPLIQDALLQGMSNAEIIQRFRVSPEFILKVKIGMRERGLTVGQTNAPMPGTYKDRNGVTLKSVAGYTP